MAITRAVALGKTCSACGKERKKKGILYHPETFMPFCDNPYVCNGDHPNSPANLIKRGGELKLIPLEEAELKFNQHIVLNQPDKEIAEKISKMVKNPTTVRIGDPRTAEFILELQKQYAFGSVAETIRYCIELVRENEATFYKDYTEAKEEKDLVEEMEAELPADFETKEEINKAVQEDVSEKEPEKNKEDDEFTF